MITHVPGSFERLFNRFTSKVASKLDGLLVEKKAPRARKARKAVTMKKVVRLKLVASND